MVIPGSGKSGRIGVAQIASAIGRNMFGGLGGGFDAAACGVASRAIRRRPLENPAYMACCAININVRTRQ